MQANYNKQGSLYTKTISNLTNIPTLSFSNSQFESRIRIYEDFSHTIYPEQKKINYLDFVYEN